MFSKLNYLCIASLILVVQTQAAEITKDLTKKEIYEIETGVIRKCGVKHEQREQEVTDFFRDWTFTPKITENLKCFFNCVFENLGILSNQKIDWEMMKLERELISSDNKNTELEIIQNCQSKVSDGGEQCELAFNVADCIKQEIVTEVRSKLNDTNLVWFELSTFVSCSKKLNVSDKDAMAALRGVKTEDRNVKCMLRCFDEIMGLVNPVTKKFDWESREKLERKRLRNRQNEIEKIVNKVRECKAKGMQDLEDECESSYLATECFTQVYSNNANSATSKST